MTHGTYVYTFFCPVALAGMWVAVAEHNRLGYFRTEDEARERIRYYGRHGK